MTAKLPPNLLALFAPRPPVRYLPPTAKALDDVKPSHISGVAQYLDDLKNYDKEVPYEPTECWLQRKARLKEEKREKLRQLLEEGAVQYKPAEDPQVRGDPFRTLFVARLSYDVTEQDLEREFGRFGPIERIRIVEDTHDPKKDSKKKNRGYAFIVYEREKDMKGKDLPIPIPIPIPLHLPLPLPLSDLPLSTRSTELLPLGSHTPMPLIAH
ncbi:U1 small nuclear ribonucleoprotein [Ascosphaera apis ARSEF 7405]|uniref:U1 small nuclear ribonucleoprotein n=1 Tax=Ascosphaera apis ARSEF 7405 TaxID=392613 RepID=A0A167ZUB7_9EURO|nr:U1 small nuclear ribonucleoprotein [Ascosphaera apis ARSEF 7405]